MISFPVSEQEKQLVHSAIVKLQKNLKEAAQAAKDVLEIFDDDFLAITEDYQKQIARELTEVSSAVFRIRIQADKMRGKGCEARIIDRKKN